MRHRPDPEVVYIMLLRGLDARTDIRPAEEERVPPEMAENCGENYNRGKVLFFWLERAQAQLAMHQALKDPQLNNQQCGYD